MNIYFIAIYMHGATILRSIGEHTFLIIVVKDENRRGNKRVKGTHHRNYFIGENHHIFLMMYGTRREEMSERFKIPMIRSSYVNPNSMIPTQLHLFEAPNHM
ncbi:hypothetical protein ACJX0J_033846, partial [Zea mays]